jgi:hypothetical protein
VRARQGFIIASGCNQFLELPVIFFGSFTGAREYEKYYFYSPHLLRMRLI